MKNRLFTLTLALLVISCKNENKIVVDYSEEKLDIITSVFPENVSKIFDAHGGIETWDAMKSLEFTMKKETGDEVTLTNLKSRESLITMPNHTIGFDGKKAWINSKEGETYKGNPQFYYNLMFYFYAMPFIVADDGIHYQNVEPLVFKDITYPGVKISYENGVGESPEDEYIIYYNPETFKMEWLGYTVTYFTKEKSKKWYFINYSNWQTLAGLVLPETLTWYNVENSLPTDKRSDLQFTAIKLSKNSTDLKRFENPVLE